MNKCPTCGMPVRVIRRSSGAADHYEPIRPESSDDLVSIDVNAREWLKRERKGKKTVAMVGTSTTSCGFAPYDDLGVEIWACNETHNYRWMTRATRWFQIHASRSFKRETDSHGNKGHYDWLKKNPWDIPIYMRYHYSEIPKSIEYPFDKVREVLMKNFKKGKNTPNYLTSSFAYMIPIAILDGFERIEMYGFEMSDNTEYIKQKACAEFWIGQAMGRGIEIYLPEGCQIMSNELYGGEERSYGA
jgi:hypothetical protein